jgi:radical SAM enzyme (TIGR01210 family)
VVPALTLFLAGAECPFTCVFCDLWRSTLDGPTPPGALPAQVEQTLAAVPRDRLAGARVKLYNASNFFDPRAVPPDDLPALARLLAPFARVIVESHPRLVGRRCRDFAAALGAGRLEVAMGLETVHPGALPRLNKRMTLADFDRAADQLAAWGVAARAFVLLGAPFVPPEETVEWAVRSAAHAFDRGVETVSLIPVRGGNGELERLTARGEFTPPTLGQLEAALEGALTGAGPGRVVTADLWDAGPLVRCPVCGPARLARLERINLGGRFEPRVDCAACGGWRCASGT